MVQNPKNLPGRLLCKERFSEIYCCRHEMSSTRPIANDTSSILLSQNHHGFRPTHITQPLCNNISTEHAFPSFRRVFVSHRNAVGVRLVRQRARPDKCPSTVHIGGGVVVPRVNPADGPSVRRSVFAHGARTRGHEIHRHESLGSGRHRPELHLGAHKRHDDGERGERERDDPTTPLGKYLWLLLRQPTTAGRRQS